MKKRITSSVLALLMVLAIFPVAANAATDVNLIDTHPPYAVGTSGDVKTYPSNGASSVAMAGNNYKNALTIYPGSANEFANFNLDGKYGTLSGLIGAVDGTTIDDSYDYAANFYGDGKLLGSYEVFPTGLPKEFSVNVTGVGDLQIEIVSPNSGNNVRDYHVGFANLVVTDIGGESVTPKAGTGGTALIDTYPPYATSNSSSVTTVPTIGTASVKMAGFEYRNALTIHTTSAAVSANFNIGGGYSTLDYIVGAVDGTTIKGSYEMTVNIYGDGTLLSSETVLPTGLPKKYSVKVTGVSDLKVEVLSPNSGNNVRDYKVGFGDMRLDAGSETTPPPAGDAVEDFTATSLNVGVKLTWKAMSGGVGYRVYRSEVSGTEGISATDFYITDNQFIDVNVDSNKTYYYSVRQVISEAKPFDGLTEVLGPATAQIKVTTQSSLVGGDASSGTKPKQFITMTINDPIMSINGLRKEIDPGRGTTPVIHSSRTVVPIRAIVEGMGGTVGWNDSTKEISLAYGGFTVKMWLNSKSISVNGASSTIDVAPSSINGRTMVPIRFAAENLGCEVEWLNSERQAVIIFR